MQVKKFSHSCVRVEEAGAVLVIDPGTLSEPLAVEGADAILYTHEHPDHFDVRKLVDTLARRPECQVYAHPAVADQLADLDGAVRRVLPGDRFEAAGFSVRAFGGLHAEIHPELPRVPNVGYFIEPGGIYHPGDSFDVLADVEVRTLFVPVAGTWLKLTDSVDFVRRLAPQRAVGLHDALLSPAGHEVVTGNMRRLCPCRYERSGAGAALGAEPGAAR
ncbi:MAG: MBL fold metallo-hydrolase [Dactylosporangium sp.]|nr:MBL fold metallo-hydrolase [Dactylosporangium sp.]NNJ63421.1 MBL fold metallo-hydrolase [Dactylosporangium sp.]